MGFCEICKVDIPEGDAGEKAHVSSKSHHRAEVAHKHEEKNMRSVFVLNVKKATEEEVKELFGKYGTVQTVVVDTKKNYAIVEFTERELVDKLLSLDRKDCPYLHGKRLVVKERTARKEKDTRTTQHTPEPPPVPENIHGATLDDQLRTLEQSSRLPPDQHKQRHDLSKRVESLLSESVRDECGRIAVVLYGSSATGLGGGASDIDLCMVTEHRLDRENLEDLLRIIAHDLTRAGYHDVVAISRGKIPLVKFADPQANVPVDLTVNNTLALRNTALVHTYLHSHASLGPVLVALKAWRTYQHLPAPTSYCLSLMAIHYMIHRGWLHNLQMRTEPNTGQSTSTPDTAAPIKYEDVSVLDIDWLLKPGECTVDGWDCYFTSSPALSAAQVVGPGDILRGFFHFYNSEFDYTTYVHINPGTHTADYYVPYQPAQNPANLGTMDIPGKMKLRSPLCVQDPFELTHNTAVSVHPHQFAAFRCALKTADEIAEQGGNLEQLLGGNEKGKQGHKHGPPPKVARTEGMTSPKEAQAQVA